MNICVVSIGFPPGDGGGIGTYVFHLANGLVKRGHKVFVITKSTGKDVEETVGGIRVYRMRPRGLYQIEKRFPGLCWSFQVARKIHDIESQERLDIVEFSNWEGMGFWYLLWGRRKPAVMRVFTPYFETLVLDKKEKEITFADRFMCWLEKRACMRSDLMIAPSRYHANFIEDAYKLGRDSVHVLPLGIKVPELRKSFIEERCAQRKDAIRILYVSRLENRKGTITLFEAIPKVVSVCPDVEFIFIGRDRNHAPGELYFKDYFSRRYGEYANKVRFLGVVSSDELESYYRQSDLFVVPSLYESFGLIYAEAMAYGLPVIGGCSGGIQEVIEDNVVGYRVEAGNSVLLADKIITLVCDRPLRQAMGLSGVKRVHALFDREKMVEMTLGLYEKTVINRDCYRMRL